MFGQKEGWPRVLVLVTMSSGRLSPVSLGREGMATRNSFLTCLQCLVCWDVSILVVYSKDFGSEWFPIQMSEVVLWSFQLAFPSFSAFLACKQ